MQYNGPTTALRGHFTAGLVYLERHATACLPALSTNATRECTLGYEWGRSLRTYNGSSPCPHPTSSTLHCKQAAADFDAVPPVQSYQVQSYENKHCIEISAAVYLLAMNSSTTSTTAIICCEPRHCFFFSHTQHTGLHFRL